jgi:p-aminobenzoyl-glutamate transporter AbgT
MRNKFALLTGPTYELQLLLVLVEQLGSKTKIAAATATLLPYHLPYTWNGKILLFIYKGWNWMAFPPIIAASAKAKK